MIESHVKIIEYELYILYIVVHTYIHHIYLYIHTVHASIGHVVYILLTIVILIQRTVPFDLIHIFREENP